MAGEDLFPDPAALLPILPLRPCLLLENHLLVSSLSSCKYKQMQLHILNFPPSPLT